MILREVDGVLMGQRNGVTSEVDQSTIFGFLSIHPLLVNKNGRVMNHSYISPFQRLIN